MHRHLPHSACVHVPIAPDSSHGSDIHPSIHPSPSPCFVSSFIPTLHRCRHHNQPFMLHNCISRNCSSSYTTFPHCYVTSLHIVFYSSHGSPQYPKPNEHRNRHRTLHYLPNTTRYSQHILSPPPLYSPATYPPRLMVLGSFGLFGPAIGKQNLGALFSHSVFLYVFRSWSILVSVV